MRAACLALLLLAAPAWAVQPDEMLTDPAQEARAQQIGQNLRCVVCASEPIESSNADLARDMRVLVREQIAAGASDADVYAFMTARYGDYVLFRPPFGPATWALWLGPFVLAAGIATWTLLAARSRNVVRAPTPLSEAERAELEGLSGSRDPSRP